jgi:hypothetical protein
MASLTVTPAPFSALTPHVAALDFDHHDTACGIEEHKVTLTLSADVPGERTCVAWV